MGRFMVVRSREKTRIPHGLYRHCHFDQLTDRLCVRLVFDWVVFGLDIRF